MGLESFELGSLLLVVLASHRLPCNGLFYFQQAVEGFCSEDDDDCLVLYWIALLLLVGQKHGRVISSPRKGRT